MALSATKFNKQPCPMITRLKPYLAQGRGAQETLVGLSQKKKKTIVLFSLNIKEPHSMSSKPDMPRS